ncbi:MAG: BMP family ABC transporter substrate-binding protein [Clostridia bacterium]|nr:BMP family ABC transporter substrate-binding protein [Clostridia bacterium]
MKKFLALMLALAMVFALAACGTTTTPKDSTAPDADSSSLKLGVILLHDENVGYDYAHIEGIKTAAAELGIADEQIIWKFNVNEDENCYDAATDLVEQGCTCVISDSYGHETYMLQAAEENLDVTFIALTGDHAASSGLPNIKNAFTWVYESRYVSGVVAGMKLKELMDAGTVTDPYVGYVAAKPYAEVISGYTAFFLGVKSIVADAHMDVQYTGEWADSTLEAEAANALIARGCVIISQHADTTGAPSAIQAALDSGKTAYSVGYNVDMLSAAPTAALTSAQNNWSVYYKYAFGCLVNGEEIKTDWAAGYAEGAVQISALGESCAAGTAEKVEEVIAGIKDGTINVFDTANFTVGGETPTEIFATDTNNDYAADTDNMVEDGIFHESTFRSAPYFALIIDGITLL